MAQIKMQYGTTNRVLTKKLLYKNGNEYTNYTGGWITTPITYTSQLATTGCSGTKETNSLHLSIINANNTQCGLGFTTNNKVELIGFDKIYMNISMLNVSYTSSGSNPNMDVKLVLSNVQGNYYSVNLYVNREYTNGNYTNILLSGFIPQNIQDSYAWFSLAKVAGASMTNVNAQMYVNEIYLANEPKQTLTIVDNDVVLEPTMFTAQHITTQSSQTLSVNDNVVSTTRDFGFVLFGGSTTSTLYNLINTYYNQGYRKIQIKVNVDVSVSIVRNNRRMTYRSETSSIADTIIGAPSNRDLSTYNYNFTSGKLDLTPTTSTPSILLWEQNGTSITDLVNTTATFHTLELIFTK